MFGWLSLLNPASLGFKVAILLLVVATTNTFTAIKVHNYVATEYQNIALTEKVAVITKEKKIAVLDTVTLGKALAAQKSRLEREAQARRDLDETIRKHEADAKPWCELNPDELRQWNGENSGLMVDTPAGLSASGSEVSASGTSPIRSIERLVDK